MNCQTCSAANAERARFCAVCGSPITQSVESARLVVGTRLGRYIIEGVLGQGGYGITYRARDERLHRSAAIKELFPEGSTRVSDHVTAGPSFPDLLNRFTDEARIMAALPDTPNLATVYELIEANGTAYLVMELVDGVTAARAVLDAAPDGMDESRVVSILSQVGSALNIVHAAGLLHRDIKPENILLTELQGSGHKRAVLIDFGSARHFASQTSSMTQMVTHGYAPLEQYGRSQRFGPTLDVYGLAATGYHLLTGVAATSAPDRVGTDPVIPAGVLRPLLSTHVSDAITRGMAMPAAERFPTAAEFCAALVRSSGPPSRRARSTPSSESAPRKPKPRTAIAASLAVAALMLIGVIVLTSNGSSEGPTSSALATITHPESPDGEVVVSWSLRTGAIASSSLRDPSLSVWTAGDGSNIQNIDTHGQGVRALAWSPRSDWQLAVASTGSDWIRVWNTSSQEIVATLPQSDGRPTLLTWSPDGKRIATASARSEFVRIWDVRSAKVVSTLQAADGPASSIAWSPDGTRLATASHTSNYIRIWNAKRGQIVGTLQGRESGVAALAWSPDGDELATVADKSPYVFVWDVRTGAIRATLQNKSVGLSAVAWSPKGDRLAVGSRRFQEIWIFDRRTGRVTRTIRGNKGGIGSLVWSPDGQRIATGMAAGGEARVYDARRTR